MICSYLVLLVVLRSVLLPLKAVIMNMLSVGAAYGVLVAVFQYGWLDSALGYDSLGYINAITPPLLLAIVFGLSMDYEVFLLSRIRERYNATGDNQRAVAEGLQSSAKVISSAAVIMVVVFGDVRADRHPADQGDRRRPGGGDRPRRDARAAGARPVDDGAHGQVELVAAQLARPHPSPRRLRIRQRRHNRGAHPCNRLAKPSRPLRIRTSATSCRSTGSH